MSQPSQQENRKVTEDHTNGPVRKRIRKEDMASQNSTQSDTIASQISNPEGGGAMCGVLEYVTVKNFMCHDHLTFPFSSEINFVQGRNGSGKSAILTAVIVGLGGTTRITNRGSSLKDLVKYGKQMATIEIGIKNCGKDAYLHKLYGDTIIVERRIRIVGGCGYRLIGKNKSLVSTKKEDLTRMLDHFNVQVDNPISVLNQDMSRAFLNSTDPHAMYKFFLKATQLQQMKDDYSQIDKALRVSSEILECRKATLPHLQKEVEEYQAQYDFCKTLNDKRKKLSELRRECAWATIIEKEKEEERAQNCLEEHNIGKEKLKKKIEKLERNYKEEEEVHLKCQEQFHKVTAEAKAVSKEVKAKYEKVVAVKRDAKDRESHHNLSRRRMNEISKELSLLQQALDKATTEAQNQWAARHAQWQEEVKKVKKEEEKVNQDVRTEETHLNNLTNTLDTKRAAFTQLKMEENALKRKLGAVEAELNGLRGQQNNQFTVFGQWVPQLLWEIDAAHKKGLFSKKPVGPLGAFVKMRDSRWGHVAEAVLGSRINAFCVDNRADEQVLRKIMNNVNFRRQQQPFVVVCKFRDQVHDVSRFEVQSSQYPSLWSNLIVSNTVVANTVIDQMQVESIMLIPTAQEAGQLLKDKATVPPNCKVAYTLNRDIYYPDPNYRIYSGRGQQPARFLQVSVEQKVRSLETEVESMKVDVRNLVSSITEAHKDIQKLEGEVMTSTRKSQGHRRTLNEVRHKLTDLQNQEEPPPPDMSQLEDDMKQQLSKLTEEEENEKEAKEELIKCKEKLANVSSEYDKLKKQANALYQEAENITEEGNKYAATMSNIQTSLNSLRKKSQTIDKQGKETEKAWKRAKENLEKQLQSAEKFQPRMNTKRNVVELQRQYESLEERLNKERAQSGDPVAVTERFIQAKQRFINVTNEIEKNVKLIEEIKASLLNRQNRYKKFRKMLSVMVKSTFRIHLSTRNLKGNLNFDFEKNTLSLHVTQMNNDDPIEATLNTSSGKQRWKQDIQTKLAMMSGGERSYSTVSFLIALWNVIASPIRILDEFDVFMDIVARKRAMKMMIQAANVKTQYIFLTPLELDAFHSNIKIFRMPDPEREGTKQQKEKKSPSISE